MWKEHSNFVWSALPCVQKLLFPEFYTVDRSNLKRGTNQLPANEVSLPQLTID